METTRNIFEPQAIQHINTATWQKITRLFIRKIIAELAHEGVLQPALESQQDDKGVYTLTAGNGNITYRFTARILRMNHWCVETDSIRKVVNGQLATLEAISFITDLNDQIGIAADALPDYMEEVAGTLYGSAYIHTHNTQSAEQLAVADYQEIERSMTGHPRFITNNGRVGFDMTDYRQYAPEAAVPFSLLWLAGHKSRTEFSTIETLSWQQLLEQELSTEDQHAFKEVLTGKGLDPEEYYFIPVHPWQWYNKLLNVFAPDIAVNRLVCLGYSTDKYLPQQSIRTFFNHSQAEKCYVKTALAILNMGYVRILSPYFMRTTPAINQWVYEVVTKDPYLQKHGFTILREFAAVGYTNQYYETALQIDSPYKKMLASLWRESPVARLQQGQRLMTMAALLHIDTDGKGLLPALIRASSLPAGKWIQEYLYCYLQPLLHCFYQYDMVFMPHGENIVLVLENHVPVSAIMKDIGEEVTLMDTTVQLPELAKRIQVDVPVSFRTKPIFTQLFDGIFRFIAAILVEENLLDEQQFWQLVATAIQNYQEQHPALKDKFAQYDFFTTVIAPDALNRMQILNSRKLRDRANPFDVPSIGEIRNPMAAYPA
ncbi:IucA/IucC family siderophore biosynthesis protein [Chitinophaga pendula]|uniref:IucA/IucC family protein n=1 Tax=Chitinophaga TaxID=79328 RepID=UPI000BB07349|nr:MULTISPECIES: IucA/IucC family siderophore biosynthesis protein [Chitinophaga]ASZ12318.1 IucA/IucC family protein [Chitinophaga sp. MD30]UCJ10089.1 IucA/IucC family siderophore biosynthesis protein [Chitinophaga pendula]